MKAHFIDIDLILKIDSKPWIVDKSAPNIPILKIEPHEFRLYKSGIYRGHGNKIQFNGEVFWIPTDLMNKLKVKTKNQKIDISNLAISMQEFLNPEIIKNMDPKMDTWILNSLVNQDVHIYMFCSKNTKRNLEWGVNKLEDKMREMGLVVHGWYYLTETFSGGDSEEVAFNKIKTVLQHMVGLKTDGDKFTNEEIQNYDELVLWDDSSEVISLGKDINKVLEGLLINTEDGLKSKIKGEIKEGENLLILKEWTHNLTNRFNQFEIELVYTNLIRSFENFQKF
jgi:hypothetical protein